MGVQKVSFTNLGASRFGHSRLNGLPTLGFSRRRPQILALRVVEPSFCFTLDVLDPWRLLAPVGRS